MSARRKKIAFFSPHAGIWPHALPESHLAKCLDTASFDTCRISCKGTFNEHCIVMDSVNLGIWESREKKEAICSQCRGNAKILRNSYPGNDYKISDFLSAAETTEAKAMADKIDQGNILELVFLGVEVGKISLYEPLLKYKKTSVSFSESEFVYVKTFLTNCLLSLMAFKHIYEEAKPDILITYSPQYGVNGVCARYCELKGAKVYFIESSANFGERYQALRIWDWTIFGLTNPALKYWHKVDEYGISKSEYDRAQSHSNTLLSAKSFSVYSEPVTNKFNLRDHFGVPAGSKVVLAAMSSYDEVFSAYVIGRFPRSKYYSDVFENQLDWIKHSIGFFASRPDLFLIIRIHPRTFPNKREGVMANEQKLLAELFLNLPANVKVNYPADKISIYDLYKEIDALLTGWSATGVEAMTYGVPVVTYDKNLPSYPASIHYTGETKDQYFQNIVTAATKGKQESIKENAYKWMAFSMSIGVMRHPAMLTDEGFVMNHRLPKLLYRAFRKLTPDLVKWVEAHRAFNPKQEARRINQLLISGGPSLFDVPLKSL